MIDAYIGLGSNLAYRGVEPPELVARAVRAVAGLGELAGRSSLYVTEPVGYAEQPRFYNAVAVVRTRVSAGSLMAWMLGYEQGLGRVRNEAVKNSARTLDMDLLLYGAERIVPDTVTVPHPRLAERRFVLAPLAEIAPELVHPVLGRTMAELLAALPLDGVNGPEAVQAVEWPME